MIGQSASAHPSATTVKQLVRESRYVVDVPAVAEAILTRAWTRRTAARADPSNDLIAVGPSELLLAMLSF